MKHKHADLIKAWADGAQIEVKHPSNGSWWDANPPCWDTNYKYRIKPEPVALNKNMTLGCPAYLHALAQPEQAPPHSAKGSADSAETFGKREWVGLTEDEIKKIMQRWRGEFDIRDIERLLKEKNT